MLASCGLVACGDGVNPQDATPQIGGERFIEIHFKDVYRPEGAVTKEAKTVDLIQTETLELKDTPAENVLQAYGLAMEADGWQVAEKAIAKKSGGWLGSWSKLGRTLVVDAVEGEAPKEGDPVPTTISLHFQRAPKPDKVTGVTSTGG